MLVTMPAASASAAQLYILRYKKYSGAKKNAEKLNEIGERLAAEYGIPYLNSDFKKRGGYQRSIELSHEYGLYRQDYCGCVFSRRERDARVAAQENENS